MGAAVVVSMRSSSTGRSGYQSVPAVRRVLRGCSPRIDAPLRVLAWLPELDLRAESVEARIDLCACLAANEPYLR